MRSGQPRCEARKNQTKANGDDGSGDYSGPFQHNLVRQVAFMPEPQIKFLARLAKKTRKTP
jgi:hypothetical protein